MTMATMFSKPATLFAALFLMTVLAGCNRDATAEKDAAEPGKGPHGGRLLTEGDFALEVQIAEEGIPPEYRLYGFDGGDPVPPAELKATITLKRLDTTDTINFAPRGDYLLGDKEIYEPHSFEVTVQANYKGKAFQWVYPSLEGRTEIKPDQLKSSGIVVETVGPARMKSVIALPGEIALNADKTAHVVPRLPGQILEVRKNLGDRVTRGEVIAVLSSGELATAREAYIESIHHRELMQATATREEALWRKKITPEEDYLRAKHALEEAEISSRASSQRLIALGVSPVAGTGNMARYDLRSPLTGVVISKDVVVGEAMQGTEAIFTLADLSTVWADITVPPNHLAAVREGQQVVVRSDAMNLDVAGAVTYVGSLVGAQTRSAKARVVIPNPNGVWKPGLFVKVNLTESEVMVPMAVKAEALQTFRDWDVVFIKVGDLFEARPLELGRREGEWVEVLSGLSPGQQYAAKNSFIIKADVMKSGAGHDH